MFSDLFEMIPQCVWPEPKLLSRDLARDLAASVEQVAVHALMAPDGKRSPTTRKYFEKRLAKEVASIAHMAVVHALRRLNATAPHTRLPNEIWHEIWEYLSLHQRLDVTHVCSSWRDLARNSPRLWCDLKGRYIALHDDDDYDEQFDCEDCCSDEYPCVDSDLGIFQTVLPLSKGLPLSLDLTLGPYFYLLENQLSTSLGRASRRLESIILDSESDDSIAGALKIFGTLPRLRRLYIYSRDKDRGTERLWQNNVVLPALEHLDIRTAAARAHTTPRSLPALITLRFSFATLTETLGYVKAAQRLSSLYLDGGMNAHYSSITRNAEVLDEIRQCAKSIAQVSVSRVPRKGEAWFLAMFHVPSRMDLLLSYRRQVSVTQLAGIPIFADLTAPVHLSLTQKGEKTAVQAVGTCGRKREIRGTFDTAELVDAVSLVLPTHSVHSLAIHLDLENALERSQSHWPDVASLTLLLPPMLHVSSDLLQGRPPPRAWSQLSTLTLEPSGEDRITVSASAVDAIVRFVHRSDLDTLVLCRVDGVAGEALSGLARAVSVDGRCVSVSP